MKTLKPEEWQDDPKDNKTDWWLPLIFAPDENGYYWYDAKVKWDGCIHLCYAYNEPFGVPDSEEKYRDEFYYIHICDLDDYINKLISLRDKAKKHFGEWPK